METTAAVSLLNVSLSNLQVRKRDGRTVPFDMVYVANAVRAAFDSACQDSGDEDFFEESTLQAIVDQVNTQILATESSNDVVDVESIQDWVENALMMLGHYQVAKKYILYRQDRSKARLLRSQQLTETIVKVKQENGNLEPLDIHQLKNTIFQAASELKNVDVKSLVTELLQSIFNGITQTQIDDAMIMVARSRFELDPDYNTLATRLLLAQIYRSVLEIGSEEANFESIYREQFWDCLEQGVAHQRYSPELLEFDLEVISKALVPQRDFDFQYLGLQTLFDRYLIHVDGRRIETPQYFWMRVAMGLALREDNREQRAIEFYEVLSQFLFVSATPTLFNSGTCHPQLSSCYLSTVDDDLEHIFKVIGDNAMLSKWAGGLGNDWTNIRATGAHIQGTNGKSQGVIPFLKIVSDTALAVNQGGKRKGAVCSYLEVWHYDIQEFIDLRKNTGDERRRTHDMHTATWIPDLFIKRVQENKSWTLFSPDEVPELHDLYGKEFEDRYHEYEQLAQLGKIKLFKQLSASGTVAQDFVHVVRDGTSVDHVLKTLPTFVPRSHTPA